MRPLSAPLMAVLILALPLLTGCGGGGSDDNGGVAVTGRVLDAGSRTPLRGVRIAAGGREVQTDAAGRFDLPGLATSIIVAASNYVTQTVDVPVGGVVGDILLVPAPLSGRGNISGIVTVSGVAAPNASVVAAGQSAVTDSTGRYTLYNVSAGAVTVYGTSADGKFTGTAIAQVIAGATATANISLSPLPPGPPPL